ncbi:MAG: ribonuclease P protein component [Bryocella sp.]
MALEFRLRKHADYQLVYKLARKRFGKQIAYFAAPRAADRRSATTGPRVGLTVPKALGGAVDRNRIKRRLREVVRKQIGLLQAPVDVVLHPRRSVLEAEFSALEQEVRVIFRSVQANYERAAAVPAAAEPVSTQSAQGKGSPDKDLQDKGSQP